MFEARIKEVAIDVAMQLMRDLDCIVEASSSGLTLYGTSGTSMASKALVRKEDFDLYLHTDKVVFQARQSSDKQYPCAED